MAGTKLAGKKPMVQWLRLCFPVVKALLSNAGVQVPPLGGELTSHMPQGVAKNFKWINKKCQVSLPSGGRVEGDCIRQGREKGRRKNLEGKTKFPVCNMLPPRGPGRVVKVPVDNMCLELGREKDTGN